MNPGGVRRGADNDKGHKLWNHQMTTRYTGEEASLLEEILEQQQQKCSKNKAAVRRRGSYVFQKS